MPTGTTRRSTSPCRTSRRLRPAPLCSRRSAPQRPRSPREMKTRAAVFHGAGRPLEVCEIELDEPGDDEVLVRMGAVGVCGTDLHSINGEWERPTPMVVGT